MDEDQFFKERPDSNIIKQVIYKYLPYWPLFVLSIGISLVITYINLRAQIPTYVATAKVLLKDPNKGGGDSKVLDALNIFSEKKIVDNEIVALQSPDMMVEVVQELDLYAQVFNKGNVQIEELYRDNSPITFKAIDKQNFNLYGTYFFSIDWKAQTINIDNKKVPFNSVFQINGTSLTFSMNESYNKDALGKNFYVVFSSPYSVAGGLAGSLRINPYSYSSTILNVNMNTTVPQKAKDVLKYLFIFYNKDAVQDKNEIANKTVNFIDDRLALVTRQLDSVERNIAAYQAKESVVDLGTQAGNYFNKVNGFDGQNSQLDLQLEVLQSVQNYIKSKGSNQTVVPTLTLLPDPSLTTLLDKLNNVESKIENLKNVTGEKNDALIAANKEANSIRKDIQENISNIRKSLLTNKQHINNLISENDQLLQKIPEKQRVYLDITRQQAIKNNIYTYLLQKREETAISSASATPDLKVIETPSSYGPVTPVAKSFYMTGLIIGLIIAAFIVLIKEFFTKNVLFRSEIEKMVKLPLVGELMQVPNSEAIVIKDGKSSVIAEQFRTIRTNLAFLGFNEDKKVLLVTSTVSGEGKSFVSLNLAISVTLTGKSVAVMEMDLRKPKLSVTLGLSKKPGISNYLVGKATIDEICKDTGIPGLTLIPSGDAPPNPSELISGDKMHVLMEEMRSRFDYIIMDTAPISPVTDAQLLQHYADLNLFVIRHGVTPRNLLSMVESMHQQKKFENMCVLFNGIKPRGFNIYGYNLGGYGNGYGYGYGYGYNYGNEYGKGYFTEEKKSLLSLIKKIFKS
jgi:capsular exopolysaccharide synthesis family protein